MLNIFNPRGDRGSGGAPSLKVVGVRERRDELKPVSLRHKGEIRSDDDQRFVVPARTILSDACDKYLATKPGTADAVTAARQLLMVSRMVVAKETGE